MKINWKVRFKNPVFYAQIILAIFTPILAYVGLTFADLTTWSSVFEMIESAYSNPYLLGLVIISVFNAVNDPNVSGIGDSKQALTYEKPKKEKKDIKQF